MSHALKLKSDSQFNTLYFLKALSRPYIKITRSELFFMNLRVKSIHDILQVSIAAHLILIYLITQSSILLITITKGFRPSLYVMILSNDGPLPSAFSILSILFDVLKLVSTWWWFVVEAKLWRFNSVYFMHYTCKHCSR